MGMNVVRWRFRMAVIVASMLVPLMATPQASALSCATRRGEEDKALKRADAAFVGELTGTRGIPSILTLLIRQDELDDTIFTFRVEKVLKGKLPKVVDVVSLSQYPLGEQSSANAVLLYDRGDGVYGSSPCSEFEPSTLSEAVSNSTAPRRGALHVSRWQLFDGSRVLIAVLALAMVSLVLALFVRLVISRRRMASPPAD